MKKTRAAGWVLILVSGGIAIFVAWNPLREYLSNHHISWRPVLVIIAATVALAGFAMIVYSHGQSSESGKSNSSANDRNAIDKLAYPPPVQYTAKRVKACLQMAVGLYALGWLGWAFILTNRVGNCVPPPSGSGGASHQLCYLIPPSIIVFKLIADALAASTVIELAYTLFTPGPDEALDPVLLAVAAALLFQLGRTNGFKWQDGTAIILYSTSLAVLFAVRVFLASSDEDDPKLWWRKKPANLLSGVSGISPRQPHQ